MLSDAEYLASPQAMEDLRVLNATFIENFVTNNVAGHDALLHPEFITIQGNGVRLDRAAYLEQWATGFDPEVITYWDTRGELITVIGDVALVRAVNKYVMQREAGTSTGMASYTDTYLYADGAWKCIQAQITPVAEGCGPTDDTIISIYVEGRKVMPATSVAGS